jgi:hypothetical protein
MSDFKLDLGGNEPGPFRNDANRGSPSGAGQ